MTINIANWRTELSSANFDNSVGIKIAPLLEIENRGTYITVIPPGSCVAPHFHKHGVEEYHIISGSGVIKLLPVGAVNKSQLTIQPVEAQNSFLIQPNIIHQLINNGNEPLTLIFICPMAHLKNDRYIVDSLEKQIYEGG